MEKAASVAPYVTLLNSAAIGIGYVYFYKQLQDIKNALEGVGKTLFNFQSKLSSVSSNDDETKHLMAQFGDDIKKLNKCIKKLPTPDDLDLVKEDIEEVVNVLGDKGTNVKLPSTKNNKRNNRKKKRNSKYDSSDDEDSEDEKPQKKGSQNRRKKAEMSDDLLSDFRK